MWCVPAGGTDEGEGDQLVPERIILRYGVSAHQSLETGVIGQVADLACVGSHLYRFHSARLTGSSLLFHRAYAKSWGTRNALMFDAITTNKKTAIV